MKLKRIQSGLYETLDGKFRVGHWYKTAGNRKSWAISERFDDSWSFVCEVETLSDAREYLCGNNVFILS